MENTQPKKGKLFVVSTPIGNREDISIRAMNVLKISDFVLCEEIKEGAKFLKSINLQKELIPLNEQNEIEQTLMVLEKLENGTKVSLISDCGTPLFADPGYHLIKAAIKAEIEIEVVPGASSLMTALVRSGMDINSFVYAGFLSRKTEERNEDLRKLAKEPRTVALLETPYRFSSFLEAAANILPNRQAYIGMNLTMAFETHHYGTFAELHDKFKDQKVKAEFVVCFEGNKSNTFEVAADKMHKQESSYERKPYKRDDRPRFDDRKPHGERSYGDRKPHGERSYGDRKPQGERSYGDRKPQGERSYDDRKKFGDRSYGDRKPHGERSYDEQNKFDASRNMNDNRSNFERQYEETKKDNELRAKRRSNDSRDRYGDSKKFGDKSKSYKGGGRKFGEKPNHTEFKSAFSKKGKR